MSHISREHGEPADFDELMGNVKSYQTTHQPLDLGVKKRLTIVTCMDSRVLPNEIFGLKLGDAEYIRNAGGRITDDVLRSLLIAQELLHCQDVIIMHHTDCGGEAALQHEGHLLKNVARTTFGNIFHYLTHPYDAMTFVAGKLKHFILAPGFSTASLKMLPIRDPHESVKEDVAKLRHSTRQSRSVNIYGVVFDTHRGTVQEVCRDICQRDGH